MLVRGTFTSKTTWQMHVAVHTPHLAFLSLLCSRPAQRPLRRCQNCSEVHISSLNGEQHQSEWDFWHIMIMSLQNLVPRLDIRKAGAQRDGNLLLRETKNAVKLLWANKRHLNSPIHNARWEIRKALVPQTSPSRLAMSTT